MTNLSNEEAIKLATKIELWEEIKDSLERICKSKFSTKKYFSLKLNSFKPGTEMTGKKIFEERKNPGFLEINFSSIEDLCSFIEELKLEGVENCLIEVHQLPTNIVGFVQSVSSGIRYSVINKNAIQNSLACLNDALYLA